MRIPLTIGFGPRSPNENKDETSINAFAEQGASGQTFAVKRPGTDVMYFWAPDTGGDVPYVIVNPDDYTGTAQGCYRNGDDVYFVRGGSLLYVRAVDDGLGTTPGYAAREGVGGSGERFTFTQMPLDNNVRSFFLKANTVAYQVYDMVTTAVTDIDYPDETVSGAAYLDGTYYVMTPKGEIYGSELEDPLTWSGLNVIRAGSMPDNGVAIRRMINYVVAFGEYTTEFFYDAGNPFGSPLSPVTNAIALVGCVCADSIADTENTLYFMGSTRQHGRSIYRLNGTVPEKISNPFIDRIISASDLTEVYAYFVKVSGHPMYILTMVDLERTLVFDTTTGAWGEWGTSDVSAWGPGGY